LTEAKQPHPRAKALRIGYAVIGAGCVCAAVIVGVVANSLGALLTTVGLACEALVLTAVLLQDGTSLPRHRPIKRGEVRALWAFGLLAALGGVAVLIDVAASGRSASPVVASIAVALAAIAGAAAMRALLKS
jgi:hypothetical protein